MKMTLSNSRKSCELAGFKFYLESFFQTLGLEFEDPPTPPNENPLQILAEVAHTSATAFAAVLP